MSQKHAALDLEVQQIERHARAGCGTSSTHPSCTCPIINTGRAELGHKS